MIRGDKLIPLNDYQRTIYNLLVKTDYKVFDEVPQDEVPPLISIGDYILSEGTTKGSLSISQQIDLYSLYEGKFEINTMVSCVLDVLAEAENSSINDTFFISIMKLGESSITRLEDGIYMATINITFEMEER